jgi:hypothetical protein
MTIDMERRLGPGWETQTPGTLLGRLGWARYEGLPTGGDPSPEDPWTEESSGESMWELKRDPVSREILNQVCIHDSDYGRSAWLATDAELSALRSEHEDKMGMRPTGGFPDLRDARERLVEMLPTLLQVTRRFYDPEEDRQNWGNGYDRSKGSIYVERWEQEGEEEGIWFFTAQREGQHIPYEDVEYEVWAKVSDMEGWTEAHYSPQTDVFKFDD